MKIEKINKALVQSLEAALAPQLISHPLMMFYCPDRQEREGFIQHYLNYYLYSWAKYGELYVGEDKKTVASLVSVGAFEYKFSGKNAMEMRFNKNSGRIFVHREIVEGIADVVVPDNIEARVLTLYGMYGKNPDEVRMLVKELKSHAEEKGFAIVYETFSKRLIPFMQEQGFETAYQKQFMDTQFIQTAMTYNI